MMTDNPNKELPNLLSGTGGCISYNTRDYQQAAVRTTCYGNADLRGHHHAGAGFSFSTSPQWSPSQMDHALLNPQVQQFDMGLAQPDRMLQHAVSQTNFPPLQVSPTLQMFENAIDGRFGPGHSADYVRPQTMVPEERGLVDPYSPDANRMFSHMNEAGNMAMQAPDPFLNFDVQNQAIQATAPSISWPQIQQQSHARNERMAFGSSSYHQSMQVVSRQGETPYDAMTDGNPALVGMYGASDSRSYVQRTVSAHLGPELLSDPLQGVVPTPSESLHCSVCQKGCPNKSALKKHSQTHDPEITQRYKCDHGECGRGFRFLKDLKKHKPVHEGPAGKMFVCQKPGCTAKSNRKDNLQRHYRTQHPGFVPILGTDTESEAASHFDDVPSSTDGHLLVQRPADSSPVADHASSFTISQTDTSSFAECIDPSLMSPTSASNSHSFLSRGPPNHQ